MPHTAAILHPNLRGNTLLQALHLADDADHLAAGVQGVARHVALPAVNNVQLQLVGLLAVGANRPRCQSEVRRKRTAPSSTISTTSIRPIPGPHGASYVQSCDFWCE